MSSITTPNLTPPLTAAKVGVMLAITAEAMYFAGLMAAYLVLKANNVPQLAKSVDGSFSGLFIASILFLCAAPVTFAMVVRSTGRNRIAWLALTLLFGVAAASAIAAQWQFDAVAHNALSSSILLLSISLFAHVVITLLATLVAAIQGTGFDNIRLLWNMAAVIALLNALLLIGV